MRHLNTRLLMQFTSGCLLHEQDAGGAEIVSTVRGMLNSPRLINFVHVKRIVLACYEVRLKFQNVVLTGGPL